MYMDFHDKLADIGIHYHDSLIDRYGFNLKKRFYIIHVGKIEPAEVSTLLLGSHMFLLATLENLDCISMSPAPANKYFDDKHVAKHYLKRYAYRTEFPVDGEKIYKDMKNFISKRKYERL